MRLVTFMQQDRPKIGAILEEKYVVDLNAGSLSLERFGKKTAASQKDFADDMRQFLESGERAFKITRNVLDFARSQLAALPYWILPLQDVRLTAPIPNPSKVVAIGQNYRDHCLEQHAPIPERPIIFAKFPTAVIGQHESITWNPDLTQQVDYEAELAVVIGKRAKNVPQAKAYDYIAGYMNANDVSARDLQFGDKQWVRGKSLDTFCPLGPYLVTQDDVPDPHNLKIRAMLNGNVMQDSNTNNLIFNVPYLLEFITKAFTLLPGDIVLTGTPHGVGVFRDPQIFMKPGDTITIEIEHLGTLTNPVVEWGKEENYRNVI